MTEQGDSVTVAELAQAMSDRMRSLEAQLDESEDRAVQAAQRNIALRADIAKKDAALREAHAHLSRRPPYNRGWNALLTQIEAALAPAAQGEPVSTFRDPLSWASKDTPDPTPAPAPSAGETVLVPREVVEFLCGAAPLEGVWFSERHPTETGAFWWRRRLRALDAAPTTGEPT